jgi:hypothetical protein
LENFIMRSQIPSRKLLLCLVAVTAVIAGAAFAACNVSACPFCSAMSLTLSQEMKAADVVVVGELVALPKNADGENAAFAPGIGEAPLKSKFKILETLKGGEHLKKVKEIEAVYFGDSPIGTQFMVTGIDPKDVAWATPIPLPKEGRKYLADIMKLPESGADRLAFFEGYLENPDQMLSRDAHDEFASAPYEDLKALAPRINYPRLIEWIKKSDTTPSHRRLYFTMLGVCGTERDLPLLESFLKSTDRKLKVGFLDAMIGSYLAIKGAPGLTLVEDLYLKNNDAEFTDTYAAIQAVRIAEEAGIIQKDKAAAALRNVLERPKIADLVIPDLARWQDWSVIDKLVELFNTPGDESAWVRVPVLRYLKVCPLPEAKEQLGKLEKLDPAAAKQAQAMTLPGGLPAPASKAPAGKTDTTGKNSAGKSTT